MYDEHLQRTTALEVEMAAIKRDLEEIKPMVKETHQRITQWGGFVTGIAVAVSSLWAFAIGFWQFVKHKFG